MIYKEKGDPKDLKNWLPISVTKSIYRLLMKILARRLCDSMVGNGLLHPNQAGFLPQHGCENQNFITDAIISEFKLNPALKELHISWLDLSKAFDLIPLDLI